MCNFTILYLKYFHGTRSALRKQRLRGMPSKGMRFFYCFMYAESVETKLTSAPMSNFTCCKVLLCYMPVLLKESLRPVEGFFLRPLRLC